MLADLVVVNHHLFFADMALRDTGVAELLPSVEVALFDEAHQLTEAGVQFLGTTLGTAQIIDFARDMLGAGLQQARGLVPWQELAAARATAPRASCASPRARPPLEASCAARSSCAGRSAPGARTFRSRSADVRAYRASQPHLEGSRWCRHVARLHQAVERALQLAALAEPFRRVPADPGNVRWIDVSPHSGAARRVAAGHPRCACASRWRSRPRPGSSHRPRWATTTKLTWFTESAGLSDARTCGWAARSTMPANARLYVPRGFPKPNEPDHAPSVAILAARCARALGGRTFVLTTTLRACRPSANALRERVRGAPATTSRCCVQGRSPKRAADAAVPGQPAAARCWWARRASGRASTCPATRCNAC